MLPPPGFEPSLAAAAENATPTSIIAAAVATAGALLAGVDVSTSTLAAVVATATAIALADQDQGAPDHHSGAAGHGPHHPPPEGECKLLGPFAIIVQGALGLCALGALVFKRWRERPQRPVKIWFFDVSKQVVGSVLVHIANLLMSMLSSGQFSIKVDPTTVVQRSLMRRLVDDDGHFRPNPCSFYLLNLAIDTTIGIPILIFLLRVLTHLFARTPFGQPIESIKSGNYGTPPKATWWFKQSIIYFIGLMGMKVCVLIIFLVLPWISQVGDWALRWTEGNETLQVIFVMLVFPVIMNATQYYIIDSFIKNQNPEHERLEESGGEEDHHRPNGRYDDPERGVEEDILFSEDEEGEAKKDSSEGKESIRVSDGGGGSVRGPLKGKRIAGLVTHRDYDPLFDGDSSPTVVGSVGGSSRGKEAESDVEAGRTGSR